MEFFYGVFDNHSKKELDYLELESEKIEASFEKLKNSLPNNEKGKIHWKIAYNMGLEKFKSYLKEHANEMTIFHFSGHHDEDNTQLSDQKINDEGIIKILNSCKRLKMVFLNGCNTEETIKKLINVPIVIGTKKAIRDKYAMEFGVKFYELLTIQLENFRNWEFIQNNLIKQAEGFQLLVNNNNSSSNNERGVISVGELDSNNNRDNYIVEINQNSTNFNLRVEYFGDLSTYKVPKRLKEVVKKWLSKFQPIIPDDYIGPETFYKFYPINFAKILEDLCNDTKPNYVGELGPKRFKKTKDLFFALFSFLKYCGYSILWTFSEEQVNKGKIAPFSESLKNTIVDQLSKMWYLTAPPEQQIARLNHLTSLYQKISELNLESSFFKEVLQFLNNYEKDLTSICELFAIEAEDGQISNSQFIEAEKFLYFFINHCDFLTKIRFASVQGSLFFKYRIETEKYKYEVRYYSARPSIDPELEQEFTPQIYDVYSIWLEELTSSIEKKPIVNLSPFYFDNNMKNPAATEIDLRCIVSCSQLNNRVTAGYCSYDDLGRGESITKYNKENKLKNLRIHEHLEKLFNLLK